MRRAGPTTSPSPYVRRKPRRLHSLKATPSISRSVISMSRPIKNPLPRIDLEAEALAALEEARAKAPGPERTEALKRAGILRNAVDMQGVLLAKRGRPPKT